MAIPIKAPPFKIGHLKLAALLLFAFALFFYRLGSYPLFDMDEPRYAEAAREMIESHNWITPHFNYELRFDKPVMFYWLIALAYKAFGLSEFSARFFSAFAATLCLLMLYVFGKRWISARFGFFSALMLGTCLMMIAIGRMSITDMTLSCFMTATTLCLFMAAESNPRWWLAAGFCSGLALLTKGPVGLVVPGAVLTLYALSVQDFKRMLINRWLAAGVLIALLVAVPWYVMAYQENGKIFINALLFHNVTRFSDTVSGHYQPVYFYVIVLLVGFLPWTAWLPAAIKRFSERMSHHRELLAAPDKSYRLSLFAAIWIVFVFCFFTISHTKLLTYILPLFPALALFTAEAWTAESAESLNTQSASSRWYTVPGWVLLGAVIIGGAFFTLKMEKLLPREAIGIVANDWNLIAVGLMAAGTLVTALLLSRKKTAFALLSQALTMALVVMVAMNGIVPNISKATQGAMMKYLARTGGRPLMIYEIQRPSLTFYGRRHIAHYVEEDQPEILAELNRNQQTFVITKNGLFLDQFRRLVPPSMKLEILEKDRVYSLLSVSKAPQQE